MKKFVFVAIFALASLFVADVVAQDVESKKEAMEQIMNSRLQMLKGELKLTDAQYAAFEPLYREYRKSLGRVADNKLARTKPEQLTNENALWHIGKLINKSIILTLSTSHANSNPYKKEYSSRYRHTPVRDSISTALSFCSCNYRSRTAYFSHFYTTIIDAIWHTL